jgi:copper homeostasis protein
MRILLEVIVSTLADAREAVRGGADRLEVVRNIELGGLTPPLDLVRAIAGGTTVPLRVMVRENAGFDTNRGELNAMRRAATAFAGIGVDGLVLGFARDGQPLVDQVGEIIDAAPGTRVTYHRAFDTLTDQGSAIEQLSAIRQIDRILTDGGDGTPAERCERLRRLSAAAGERLTVIAGSNVDERMLEMIAATGCVREVHVGRAARPGHDRTARVSADLVRSLRHLAGL